MKGKLFFRWLSTLVTAIKKGGKFQDYHPNDGSDEIMAQDECTRQIIRLKWSQEVPYGTRILAGEPCHNTTERRIVYLQVGSFVGIDKPLKTALTCCGAAPSASGFPLAKFTKHVPWCPVQSGSTAQHNVFQVLAE